jgi:hypothetical protein
MGEFTGLDFGSNLSREVSEAYEKFWTKNQLTTVWANGEGRTVRTSTPRVRPKAKSDLDFRNKKKGTKEGRETDWKGIK